MDMNMNLKIKPHCWDCQGMGQVFVGAEMRPNPYDYSDYNEVWTMCETCGGTGRSWRFWLIESKHQFTELLRRIRRARLGPPKDIPF